MVEFSPSFLENDFQESPSKYHVIDIKSILIFLSLQNI